MSEDELAALVDLVGGDPTAMVRDKIDDTSREGVIRYLLDNPKAMQRPVGVNGDRAVIARPEDLILEILD